MESGGTVDYGRGASRIRVFGDLGPTADAYEPVLGYHPLARHFVSTGDRRPATMQVAQRYVAERKLGVHDLLTAVLVAQQNGVPRAQPHGRLAACPT